MYRLTIRATDESLPALLLKTMEDLLAQGIDLNPPTLNSSTLNGQTIQN